MENSQTIRGVAGSSVKTTWNRAKSTWRLLAWRGLEAQLEAGVSPAGRTSRRKSVTAE